MADKTKQFVHTAINQQEGDAVRYSQPFRSQHTNIVEPSLAGRWIALLLGSSLCMGDVKHFLIKRQKTTRESIGISVIINVPRAEGTLVII